MTGRQENIPTTSLDGMALSLSLLLSFSVHTCSYSLAGLLLYQIHSWLGMWAIGLGILTGLVLVQWTLMILSALVIRWLPKPKKGGLRTSRDIRRQFMLLVFVDTIDRSPCRWLPPLAIPWFIRLAGGRVGSGATILRINQIVEPWAVDLGDRVTLGFGCALTAHISIRQKGKYKMFVAPISIDDGVVIGSNTLIGPGVHIGKDALIMAGSMVPPMTTIKPGEVWSGVPAQCVEETALCESGPSESRSQLDESCEARA